MENNYKIAKEAFVSGQTGSSIAHINLVALVSPLTVAIYFAVRRRSSGPTHALTEFLLLIVPLILSITIMAEVPGRMVGVLLVIVFALSATPHREFGTPLPSSRSPSSESVPTLNSLGGQGVKNASEGVTVQLAPLTIYRSHMMLLTCLSILAVDFPAFPRFLAKCETFGVSMMDLGVGSFVFSQGIVSAIPLIKNPAYLAQPLLPKFVAMSRKCVPLLILGVLRTLSVKGVEYPEHETEYGTHWNFFFTLAVVHILQVALDPLILRLPISLLGVLVAIFQQAVLNLGLMNYVLTSPRTNLVSANKEGLVSLLGYLAIHLLGLSTGTILLPPTPSYFRRRLHQLTRPQVPPGSGHARSHEHSASESDEDEVKVRRPSLEVGTMRENDKTAIELISYAVLWWVFLGALKLFDVGGGVSRRLVNLQYIVWVAAFNATFLCVYLLLDLLFFASPFSKSVYSPVSKLKVRPDPAVTVKPIRRDDSNAPSVLVAMNRNGLAIFLLGNVLTGLVNLVLPTMYMGTTASIFVLLVYSGVLCIMAWKFQYRKVWMF